MFIDLDGFKCINDSLGHDAGDELLQVVSGRLRHSIRQQDIVARLGGDEFVILLKVMGDQEGIQRIAETILKDMGTPFKLVGGEVKVSTSIGIASFPKDSEDREHLIKCADTAMYQAKNAGKNGYRFYKMHHLE